MFVKKYKDQPVTHWLYAGPYLVDVSDRYYDNYSVRFDPYKSFWDEAKQKIIDIKAYPVECDRLLLFGIEKKWELLRPDESEKKVTWNEVKVNPRLLACYTYSKIISQVHTK